MDGSRSEYGLKSKGLDIKHQAVLVHPLKAFNEFVRPGLTNEKWIEDSRKVTDTNMSMREWAGLVVHAFSLMGLTGQNLTVGKDFIDGDGVIVRINDSDGVESLEGIYVEQTLVTHIAHSDLTDGIRERISSKSANGESYADNMHLIVWCNIEGEFDTDKIAEIVSEGLFNIVDIVGFDGKARNYKSLIFDKDKGLIHRFQIKESDLFME